MHLGKNYRDELAGTLGEKYWHTFCNCYHQESELKKSVMYDMKWDDYDGVYDIIVKCGVEKLFDDYAFQDRKGNIVLEDNPKIFGRKTKHILIHPG
jgi:hypothetical protein